MTKRNSTASASESQATYTPGPWMVEETDHLVKVVVQNDPSIQFGSFSKSEKGRANAMLIAAAPTLYDAIDRAQARWDDMPNFLRQNGSKVLSDMMTETLRELRDALTLADGFKWQDRRTKE